MKKDVLIIEFQEVFDKVACRIVFQDESVLKRKEFGDTDIRVFSIYKPSFCEEKLFIKGSCHEEDESIFVVSKEEAEAIKQKVKQINEKYGIKERWRAHNGERYYAIEFSKFESIGICNEKDVNCSFDKNSYELGNYFKTREQAEEACRRFKEVLKQYQEELLKN